MIAAVSTVLVLPAAWVLDLIFGDPEKLPHPVRWMGAAIAGSEPKFRSLPVDPRVSGALMAAFLIGAAWTAAAAAVAAARWIAPAAATVAEVLILYFCISTRSLASEAEAMARVLSGADRREAARRLKRIVGRDTENLSRSQMARATVETVAENLVDGVLSPLFFAAIGGVPLAAAFRMANTLDAMIGYRNERYLRFGNAAARIDDAANWIPARLSMLAIGAAAQLLNGRGRAAVFTAVADGRQHSSPNAGFSEAAFAGALKVRLGGPSRYGGKTVPKPWIGARFGQARLRHVSRSRDLLVLSSLIGMAGMTLLALGRGMLG